MSLLRNFARLLATALLLQTTTGSLVETFSDANCQTSLNDWRGPNGYPDGECTALSRQGNYTSFKIVNLDPGCAITIYGPGTKNGPCDSSAAPGAIVAKAGNCYNTTWAFYSLDLCTKLTPTDSSSSLSSTTSSSTTLRTSTTSSASSATSTAPAKHHSGTNVGAIVGGVIGGVAFGIIVAAIAIVSFIRYRRVRRNRPPSAHGLTEVSAEVSAKEADGGAYFHTSRPGTAGSAPGTPGGAQELPTEGIPELPNYPLAELPEGDHRSEMGPKSPTTDIKI